MKKLVLRILGFLVVLGILVFAWYRFELGAVDASSDARVSVTIPAGAGLSSIADILEEKGVIRSSTAFSWYVRVSNQDHLLRAGAYALQTSMDATQIARVLTGDSAGEVSITIPEGFTVANVDRLMAERGFTETGAIIACAKTCDFMEYDFLPTVNGPGGRVEGYLYPDTYFVGGEGSDPKAFLDRLLTTFETNVVKELSGSLLASDHTLHEIVTMASLIEEEAANDDERATISGILWKRFDEGILLGVDAAVRYIVGKPREALTRADLAVDSPYNLRTKRGLPPGPIANPGLASIKAALEPEASPYYYYLHGNDGKIHYAVTNDEHNLNRQKFLN